MWGVWGLHAQLSETRLSKVLFFSEKNKTKPQSKNPFGPKFSSEASETPPPLVAHFWSDSPRRGASSSKSVVRRGVKDEVEDKTEHWF